MQRLCRRSGAGHRDRFAGIRIHTTLQPEWDDPVRIDLPEPTVSVPAEKSASPLSRVLAAELLANGSIAVLDGLLEQLILYDQHGREVRTIGSVGEGPGEFLQAISMQELPDGRLQVYDGRQRRLTTFTPDGKLTGVHSLPAEGDGYPARAWQVSGGELIVWYTYRDLSAGTPRTSRAGFQRFPGALLRLNGDTVTDTLLLGVHSLSIREGEGSNTRLWSHPFGSISAFAVDGEGSRILFTSSASHSIQFLDLSEGVISRELFRFPMADTPVDPDELEARRDRTRRALAEEGASSTTALDFLFEPALQPDVRPAFSKLLWGPDGSIWAQRFEPSEEDARLWWVISAAGAFRGLVEMPERTEILAFEDGHMLLLRLNHLDVPSVHLVPFSGLERE